jgi:hypothetical protein
MELEGKTVLITPEMAEEFLTHNIRNRNIRLPYVDELATYMRQGKWDVTHQGIVFYEDGTLFDGQHRLHAIIKAGIPVKMMVTYGIPLATTHADTGLKRSEADLVKLMGNSEFQWVGAREIAITNILKVQFPRLGLVTLEDKAAFMQFYKNAYCFAKQAYHPNGSGLRSAAIYAAFVCAYIETGAKERLSAAGALLASGLIDSTTSDACSNNMLLLRNYVMRAEYRKLGKTDGSGQNKVILFASAKALASYMKGKPMRRITIPNAFPFHIYNQYGMICS